VLAYLRILHVKTMFGEYRRGVVACMYFQYYYLYTVLTCVLNSRLVDALMSPLVRVAFAFFFVCMMLGHLRPFYCFLCLICFIYARFMLCFSFLSVMNSAVVVLLFAHLVFDLVLSY
jgi:hypothetical protein